MAIKMIIENVTNSSRVYVLIILLFSAGFAYPGTIGFFFALDEDKSAFEAAVGNPIRTINLVGGTVAFEYRVGAHRVVAAKMGSGCVSTAVTVARVLALNPVDRIICTGPAGAIGDQAGIGTWYRIGEVAAWQQGRAGEGGRVFPSESALRKVSWKPDDWPEGAWVRGGASGNERPRAAGGGRRDYGQGSHPAGCQR